MSADGVWLVFALVLSPASSLLPPHLGTFTLGLRSSLVFSPVPCVTWPLKVTCSFRFKAFTRVSTSCPHLVKHLVHIDDALDLFAEHAVGGIVGLTLNAFFADSAIIALDGVSTTVPGGFMNHNWALLYKQICFVLAACSYTFVVTAAIAKAVDTIPGLQLRAGPETEAVGMDEVEVRV